MRILQRLSANVLVIEAIGAFLAMPGIAVGQEHDHTHDGHDHDGHSHGDHAHAGESLAFQLTDWKSMHFDDANRAALHVATVKKLAAR